MEKSTSSRLSNVELSATYAILDMVQELRSRGVTVIDMGGGEPDFSTPAHVAQAAISAIADGLTHYTPSRGAPELLVAIAQKLAHDNGIRVDPCAEIIVTPSAKHALFITLMAILSPGDEIIIPTPSWVSYKSMVQLGGACPIELPLRAEDDFTISGERLASKLTPRTKAILINTPNNPTGHALTYEEVSTIVEFACRNELLIVADEIYEKIIYGDVQHISIASLPGAADRTLTINGFSKAYAMTGWRLGYVAGPRNILGEILKVHQHTVGCASSFVQKGGLAALTGDREPLKTMLTAYSARRKLIVDGLNSIPGITCSTPDGAFYAFPDIRGTRLGNSADFSQWLLKTAGVAVTPGSAFGSGGEGHVRLSYATSSEVIADAVERIRRAVLSQSIIDFSIEAAA
ncbi:MAG TPA: pyridoxal phosphate-dependent aminotransferase [Gallionella sp.]|nr:pyridoxal phosphate-dependent aminotransferase [Gallionella sp.]